MSEQPPPTAEGVGETVGEAKWAAVRDLERRFPGLDKSRVAFQVISEGERGLMGVGREPARVIASLTGPLPAERAGAARPAPAPPAAGRATVTATAAATSAPTAAARAPARAARRASAPRTTRPPPRPPARRSSPSAPDSASTPASTSARPRTASWRPCRATSSAS